MNENERTPAETAVDYAVHFADGFFVPCPCCGKEVESPDNGFTSEKEAMEWAEFHPAATIMRYCRQLAAPAPYWEPPTYKTGSCCFCGQLRVLPFAAPTQEEADRYATDKCDCEIGKACRRQREEREIIAGLFAEFEPDTLRLLEATADMVRKDYIKGGTAIKLAENVTAKFKIKDGTVIVTRSEKHEHQHSL